MHYAGLPVILLILLITLIFGHLDSDFCKYPACYGPNDWRKEAEADKAAGGSCCAGDFCAIAHYADCR